MRLQNEKVALGTGAGGGLGAATARAGFPHMAERGSGQIVRLKVTLNSRDDDLTATFTLDHNLI